MNGLIEAGIRVLDSRTIARGIFSSQIREIAIQILRSYRGSVIIRNDAAAITASQQRFLSRIGQLSRAVVLLAYMGKVIRSNRRLTRQDGHIVADELIAVLRRDEQGTGGSRCRTGATYDISIERVIAGAHTAIVLIGILAQQTLTDGLGPRQAIAQRHGAGPVGNRIAVSIDDPDRSRIIGQLQIRAIIRALIRLARAVARRLIERRIIFVLMVIVVVDRDRALEKRREDRQLAVLLQPSSVFKAGEITSGCRSLNIP